MAGRLLAGPLLGAFLLLTVAPVCGSPTDVDPLACCHRNGCKAAVSECGSGACPRGSERQGVQAGACVDGGTTGNPADCCRRGSLSYPVARGETISTVAAFVVAFWAVSTAHTPQVGAPARGFFFAAGASPPARLTSIALYTLHSTFRI
jgi:hypothetical protein